MPIHLGELGQSSTTLDETIRYTAIADLLNNAFGLCFKGAVAWCWDADLSVYGFLHADATARPAVAIMQTFGARP